MHIERKTHPVHANELEYCIYEVLINGVSLKMFNGLNNDTALVDANELIEDQAALAKTRGENPTITYN